MPRRGIQNWMFPACRYYSVMKLDQIINKVKTERFKKKRGLFKFCAVWCLVRGQEIKQKT